MVPAVCYKTPGTGTRGLNTTACMPRVLPCKTLPQHACTRFEGTIRGKDFQFQPPHYRIHLVPSAATAAMLGLK